MLADEVDDLLALKARPMERVTRFSAEIVTSTEVSQGGASKTLTSRQRITLERGAAGDPRQWRVEVEAFEPRPMKMRKDGERVQTLNAKGEWEEVKIPAAARQQLAELGRQFTGTDASFLRRQFGVSVVRHNHPLFGPRTTTIAMVPAGPIKIAQRVEEDVAEDGLPLATRIYDAQGREAVAARVTKRSIVNHVPLWEEMDVVGQGPNGAVRTSMTLRDVQIDRE